jgi:uncharacterized membrane protein
MGGTTKRLPYIDSMLRRALRSARRSRVIAYSTVVVLVVVLVALASFAAPCPNWKDGSCESNWASDAQWRLLPVLLLAMLVVIWFAVRDNLATLRRLSQDQ